MMETRDARIAGSRLDTLARAALEAGLERLATRVEVVVLGCGPSPALRVTWGALKARFR
jgi:hypothetical protein